MLFSRDYRVNTLKKTSICGFFTSNMPQWEFIHSKPHDSYEFYYPNYHLSKF